MDENTETCQRRAADDLAVIALERGLDVSDVDCACDIVLFSEFTDHAALAAYAAHLEHLRVREALGDLRIGRFQVDYPIRETGA
ncbi:hypothetical protein AC630_09300 [Bradyrhizobium sp. AS23.2]|nr:hypothetical protein AC630_09300 [Bradyrhizobium sp. AS23.2]